ncbi:hypothetical protein ACFWY6_30045 [Streptomyces sp. NPDC059037]|uniref:hypothetical protein n=1 Tax=Streptomyces sp. NPDC059037 TaxID=3346710 RepID=UPI0036A372BE
MAAQLSPPEALLALAADYNRHNDALNSLAIMEINGTSPATAVSKQIPRTQHLADSALHIVDALNHQRMCHSLDDARVGAPSEDGPPLTLPEARPEVRDRLVLVRQDGLRVLVVCLTGWAAARTERVAMLAGRSTGAVLDELDLARLETMSDD